MFDPLFDLVTAVLAWFYSFWPSYGMAIAFLTLTVMVISTPFTLKGIRSMLLMQQYAPELKKIQNEHRGDRQAMNEATMAFYREHGVNPLGGCLPMLVQAPIFLVLYRVVHGLTRRTTEIGTQLGFTSMRFSEGTGGATPQYAETPIARSTLTFDPDFLSMDTDLYMELNGETEMVSWGIDLSRSASAALSESVVDALPYFLMIILVFVTGLYQQRQIHRRQKGAVMPKQQEIIMKLIPYFLPVFSYGLPAAVVVYFIVSALYRIVQQAYITRSLYTGEDSLGARAAKQRAAASEATPKSRLGRPSVESKAKSRRREASDSSQTARRPSSGSRGGKAPVRGGRPAQGHTPPRRRTHRSSGQVRKSGSAREGSSGKRTHRSSGQVRKSGSTAKAPSRNQRGRGRAQTGSGRVTAPGSSARRANPNRSKNKKKRR